jgi:hypothetical protein
MSKKEETKELEVKQSAGALAALQGEFSTESNPELSAQDILIAKVLLMQFMSEKVTEGVALAGDFRDSVTDDLLGSFKAPMEFIPFHLTKTFIEFKEEGQDKKFVRIVPINSNPMSKDYNDELPYEEVINGERILRDRTMNVYVLDPNNPEMPPRIISFRRSSLKAGKQLATGMYVRNASSKLPPYAYIWQLAARLESNDKGKYYVFEAKSTPKLIDASMIGAIKFWTKQVSTNKVREDISDINEASAVKEASEVESGAF